MLLVFHAIVTFAAGIVLVIAPNVIPNTIGLRIDSSCYLICYLLAGCEFGFAFLSYFASKLKDNQAVRVVSLALIVFHVSTGALEIYAFTGGLTGKIWANVVFRFVVSIAFWYLGVKPNKKASKRIEI